jgi:hypothetical protein
VQVKTGVGRRHETLLHSPCGGRSPVTAPLLPVSTPGVDRYGVYRSSTMMAWLLRRQRP